MSFRKMVLLSLHVGVLFCSSAQAALTVFWQQNAITPQAITDDPALAGMQSWSLMATNGSPDNLFSVAALRAALPFGATFYRNSLGEDIKSTAASQSLHPSLTFNTYVTYPAERGTGLAFDYFFGERPLSFGGFQDPLPGTFRVTWLNPNGVLHPPGTYELARMTFPQQAVPAIDPRSEVQYSQVVTVPPIPEPAAVGLLLTLLCLDRSPRRLL